MVARNCGGFGLAEAHLLYSEPATERGGGPFPPSVSAERATFTPMFNIKKGRGFRLDLGVISFWWGR